MPKGKHTYEVVEEFNQFAHQIVDKYPEIFDGINVDKIRCVKITNNTRAASSKTIWKNEGVSMPIRMDCPFSWYVSIHYNDWDGFLDNQKLLLITQVLLSCGKGEEGEGKVIPPDNKDYEILLRTFGGPDYILDPSVPNIIDIDIEWITAFQFKTEIEKEESKI
jgi:hypothetical protein